MRRKLVRTVGLLMLLVLLALPASAESSRSCQQLRGALQLYKNGCIAEARASFEADIHSAETSLVHYVTSTPLWNALISAAWFEDETGHHDKAIEYSNRALQIASDANDPFLMGRSLSWLGWSYSSMGMYHAAIDMYKNALEYGAPGGVPKLIPIWGLSTQELGALYVRMGRVAEGQKLIEQTYSYAKQNGVDIGVAEGGVHLVDLALKAGDLGRADTIANETLTAAKNCDCGPQKISRAMLALARVAVERAKASSPLIEPTKKQLEEVTAYAEKVSDTQTAAEARLLESQLIPAQEMQRKLELITTAYDALETEKSELRGTAEATLGHAFLESLRPDLADYYLSHGIKVNKEMFRTVDNAYVLKEVAALHDLTGERQTAMESLTNAATSAQEHQQWAESAKLAEQLSEEYEHLGYSSLARQWSKRGISAIDRMLEVETDPEHRRALSEKRASFGERAVRSALETETSTDIPTE